MKMKHIAGMFTLALAAFAAPLTTFAVADGDIYEIVSVKGSCTPETALTSGDDFEFVVRLMARDDTDRRQWGFAYNTSSPTPVELASVLYPPSIGVVVGGRLVSAVLCDEVVSPTKMYTDLHFRYTVRPGDIALPAKLALEGSTSDNPIYADSDFGLSSTTPYCLLQSIHWSLEDELGNKAKLLWGEDFTRTEQTRLEVGTSSVRSYDYTLELANFHVKSILLGEKADEDQEGDDLWQVNEGSTKPFPVTTVGVPENAVTLYAWADEEDAVKVKGAAASVTLPDSSVVTRQMYTFKVTTGVTEYTIPVTGVASNKSGKVVLSPKPGYTYDAAGALVTNFITRTVKCIEALPPSISATFDSDKVVASVTASTNDTQDIYITDAVPVTISLTEPFGVATNVTLSLTLVDSPAADVFASNYVGVAVNNTAFSKPPVVTNVFFAADSTEATVYVYPMGGDSMTYSGGIHIVPVLPSGAPFDKYTPAGCTLRIKDATPAVVSPTASSAPFAGTVKGGCDIDIEIRDCYRDQNTPQTFDLEFNFSDGSTFKTNGIAFARGVAKTVNAKGFGSSATWAIIKVTDSQGNSSVSEQVPIIVEPVKTVSAELVKAGSDTAEAETELVFPEGASRWVRFKVNQPSGADMYAFLVPLNEASSNLVSTAHIETGTPIAAGTLSKVLPNIQMSFLDGCASTGDLQFDVQLRTGSTTNDALITTYDSQKLYISVTNVPPYLKAAQFNGSPVSNGGTVTAYSGTDVKLKATAADVSLVDLRATNDNERVVMRWMYSDGPVGEESWTTVFTTNAENEVSAEITAVFNAEGTTQTVEVRAADKDMLAAALNDLDAVDWDAAPAYRYSVKVNPPPSVTVLDDGGNDMASYFPTYTEMNNGSSSPYVTVKLSPAPNGVTADDPLTVQLVLTKNGDGNARLSTTNLATFTGGKATSARVYLYDLDGAYDSSFTILAAVVTTNKTSSGTRWCDYYAKGEGTFRVLNVSPEITGIAGVNTSVTNKTTLGATVSMSATVKDISADLAATNKFSVTWYDAGGAPNKSKSLSYTVGGVGITNNVVAAWDFSPSVEGYFSIRVSADDGDGSDPDEKEIWFYVEPSKQLQVSPYHPVATTDTRYKKAMGAGTGRIWANGVRVTASDWVHTWYYNVKTAVANVYAWGYPGATNATGYADNGKLGQLYGTVYRDVALTAAGATSETPLLDSECYTYASPYDNFFYTWAYVTPSETGGSPAIEYGNPKPTLSPSATVSGTITLDEYQNDKESYAVRMMEAIFSREYRLVDNLGDINADGVPDLFAVKYAFDAYDAEGAIVGNDLESLADYNADGDFYGATTNSEQKFTAPMEIRGLHDGLNYGMFPVTDEDGWVSDLDMSLAEKKALIRWAQADTADPLAAAMLATCTDPADDAVVEAWLSDPVDADYATQQAAAKSYISSTWSGYVEGDVTTWGFTVENRTSPVNADTDGDEMPDGYEYYWWYAATVGSKADGTGLMVGKRFNLSDIENPTDIPSDEIARTYNPNVKRNWTEQDTDNDGLLDVEERAIGTNPLNWDSDGDGLPDVYEVMWSIDPLKNENGVNGAMNADGDFMAVGETDEYFTIYDIEGALYAVRRAVRLLVDDVEQPIPYMFVPGSTNEWTVVGLKVGEFDGGYIPLDHEVSSNIAHRLTVTTTNVITMVGINSVNLYHYQVYGYFGFDPRTGWFKHKSNDSLSNTGRWLSNGSAIGGARAVNTEPFTAINEFKLLKFRYMLGLRDLKKDLDDLAAVPAKTTIAKILAGGCTNPNAVKDSWSWPFGDKSVEYPTTHGADTDKDGVPDGWELYVGVNPNVPFTDTTNEGLYNVIRADDRADGLALDVEYAGTDSCGVYEECESIFANHPSQEASANHLWFNKFFPTDPRSDDTDADGINDGEERATWTRAYTFNRWGQTKPVARNAKHFSIYGTPQDLGSSRCIPGAGFNPCTIDTDSDALPDLWERQYAGILINGSGVADAEPYIVFKAGVPDSELYDDIRAALAAYGTPSNKEDNSGWYVIGGQDGTVSDAATKLSLGANDLDWDADGLQNWQEYIIQAVRHFRYDDCKTPLMGFDIPAYNEATGKIEPGAWNGATGYLRASYVEPFTEVELNTISNELNYVNFAAWAKENPDYLGLLGYFADPPKRWDVAHLHLGWKYMMPPNLVHDQVFSGMEQLSWEDEGGTNHTLWVVAGDTSGLVITNGWPNYVHMQLVDGAEKTYETMIAVDSSIWGLGVGTIDVALEPLEAMVTRNRAKIESAYSYVGTDPRLWDTDADGMDDYWEMFHGLNPILGATSRPATEGVTNENTTVYYKDIIAEAYILSDVSANKNGWTGWDNESAPPYDPIRYPWMMGTGDCDADGDGFRNDEEGLYANTTSPGQLHTDPTPFWMTDFDAGVTNVPSINVVTIAVTNSITGDPVYDFVGGVLQPRTVSFAETNSVVTLFKKPSYTALYYQNEFYDHLTLWQAWRDVSWCETLFSFEENEGYDTDNDWRSDSAERKNGVEPTSDPLDFSDPSRRQSLWLGGRGVAVSPTPAKRYSEGVDLYRQFTVEAWARPENPVAGEDQYVASRAVNYTGWDATHTNTVIRMNFAIGIDKDGHAFAEYENTTRSSCRIIADEALDASATNWVHLAATYDGSMLCLYVNGDLKKDIETTMPPATGVLEPQQDPQAISHFPYVAYYAMPSATIVGGKVCGPGAFDVDAAAKTGIDGVATNFFKGSVDEVRMWDGARSAAELKANYRKAFTTDEIKEMRSSTALKFMSGMRRNNNSGETSLPCELVQHYNFQTLAGATETNYVQKVPAGFANNMLANVMSPADGSVLTNAAEILWWKNVVENGDLGSVYDSKFVVPWIENTIAHLPMICGAMKDSFYWSENFAGFTPASFHGLSKFAIPNSMNPYNAVKITSADDFRQEQRYRNYVDEVKEDENDESGEAKTSVWYRYRYDIRIAFTATTDLLPLGDAYAKRLTDNWDGIGVDDAWASTTDGTGDDGDPDDTGIPEWAKTAGYTTAKAYRAALEDGLLPTGMDPDYRTYVGDADTNGNNIPDWWENHFGIMGCDPNEDLDNDGLSNYQEFFVSFGNWSITTTQPMSLGNEIARNVGMPFLDPTNPHSGTNGEVVVDYFLKPDSNWTPDPRVVNGSYLGQMVTDHDFMESWWEHKNDISYSNAFVYDPQFDGDGDGWSNFSEARAYSWHGGYIASIIDRYFSANEEYHDVCYPVPAIGVRPTYYGMQNISGKGLVVRTMTSADKRVDATFAVPGSTRTGDAADAGSHFVGGYIGDASLHGFLHPGRIMPSSDIIIYRRPVNDSNVYVWHLNPEKYAPQPSVGTYVDYQADVLKYGETDVILDAVRPAEYEFARAYSDTEGRMGEFVVSSTNAFGATEVKIGKIDYLTGEYSFNPDLARQIGVDPSECVYRIAYSYVIGDEWPQTLWLSDTSTAKASGRVKEGKNTIEAFIDINANGAWDLGEPYGAVKDVDIGWHKTPEALTIELKDNPSIPARMALALGGANEGANAGGDSSSAAAATASVLVRRVAINGTSENMPVRTLVTRSVASDDRAYLTEADLVSAARPDLDWAWLVGDAETMGIASIDSVTYSVETHETLPDGTVTNNVLGIFTRSFGAIRRKPTALAPAYEAPVYTARPTFTFVSGDDTMTAYCVQISTNDTADGVIWESGARLLPGRAPYTVGVDAAYSVSPDFFVDTFATTNGSAFVASGTNYYWRVAVMNAKFKDLADDAWSDWMAFQMDVGNGNRKPDTQTGCGDAAVAVRYYGACNVTGTDGATNVVVEAYASADFTGVPLARVRLADVSGITNVTDVTTTNAVLRGLPSGDAYLLAYIDSNNDGKRQAHESWGYANRVGEDTKFIYTPVPVAIEDTMGKYPSVTIFIEDTDVNQNEMPDVLELDSAAWSTGEGVDADGDGLTDELEGDYGTDANLWDTDGDGMPDGWEALFANTDPTLDDANGAVDGDVMAYAEVTRTVVTFVGDATTLFVVKGSAVPQVGDEATNYTYLTTYDYGSALGVGTNFTASATDRIASVETRSVALVHAQVYSEYGFNPATANPTKAESERVNTKEFTALDKYLVARYLEAYGVTNVSEVAMNTNGTWASYTLRPGTADTNGDGVADGWELYVMFGTNTTVSSVDDMKVSPFGTAAYVRDVANTPDAGSLSILDEFDRGNTPTDPWQKDTDGDGIEDKDAFRFKIKTAESQLGDDDNDGLSNWAEYLAWKLTGLDFDVSDPCSVADNRLDYYFVVTNGVQEGKYVGECVDAEGKGLIADHDFVEDRLETQYSELAPDGKLYANRYVWDALRDADGDGWSNWSEVRSGTRPTSVSGLDVDGNTDADYPQPVVALTVSYNGSDRFNAPIMVQAWSEEYAAGQPDAAWQIGESAGEEVEESDSTELAGTENTRYLGFNTGDVRTFYIGPGKVIPGSVSVKFKDPEWMLYHYTYGPDGTPMFYGGEVHSLRDATWQGNVRDKADKNDPSMGKIYFSGTVTDDPADSNVVERVVGSVNYSTGEVTLDFSVLNNTIYFSGSISSELTLSTGNLVSIVNMSESYVQIAWRSGKTEIGTHSTYFLGKPNATEKVPSLGHLREGEATFIVFSDTDGNGVYTEGEPLGVVKHVKVGWDKVSDLAVELSETSRSADRFVVDAITNGVATTRIKVMRTAINGRDVSPRVVYSRTIDFTSARLFTEADFIADGEWDFDWKRLCSDAVELAGVSTNDISSVGYAVYLGSSTEPVRTFTRTFAATNVPPVATSTYAGGDYLVRTARPTLQWSGAENGTAFALQIADAFANVVYATTNFMPAATESGYAFKPEAYVGAELKDGSNYFWRVSSLNSKFREPTWSKPAEFKMAVASDNADTGYGRLGLEVRYFGPASNELSEVVVGVYESADFAGAPVARVRMSGTGTVASLTNDLSNAFAEAVTNVVLDGIAPGRYFAMAFIDSNTNGVRDAWETWGYVNKVATESADLWTPVATEVVSTKAALPTAFLVMEDTDANQNAVPDCLDDASTWKSFSVVEDESADSDGDGLTDFEENYKYGTDPALADTDGDGVPDGYEVDVGTDPLNADADFAGLGDYMAYAEVEAYVFSTNGVSYILNVDRRIAYETFSLGDTNDTLVATKGVTNVNFTAYNVATNALSKKNVVLVHSAVYDWFGFDATTAMPPAVDGTNVVASANTIPFTAYWKYLTTTNYLAAFDVALDAPLSVKSLDYNANGLPDGWELYVAFANPDTDAGLAANDNTTFPVADAAVYLDAVGTNSVAAVYDPYDQYYLYRGLLDEDPATYGALAPFTNAEALTNGWLEAGWDWNKALPGDYMAYAEVMAQLVMSNDVVYAVHVATNEFGAVTATNLYETFTLENGMVVVGKVDTNATVTAGLFSATVSTNVVLVHSAVYDWFGFNPTTALAPSGEGTNVVAGVNTAPFTAAWKEVTEKLYLNGLFGIGWTFDAGVVDSNANGLPDGWELYVAFAHDADNANEAAPAFPLAGASLATAVSNFDEGDDVSDPWNERYFWELLGDEKVAVYNNDEARMFNLTDGDLLKDEDFDGLSNYKEFLAASVYSVTTDVHNAMSDGLTNDYFRATGGSYLGLELNGGEFIESDARAELGMQALRLAGTVARGDGWDYWSAARSAYANAGTNGVDFSATPVPEVRLRLSNAKSGTRSLTVSACQVKEDIGEVLQAQWAVSADFAGGVAEVVLGKPDTGALKQGWASFVVVDEALGARGRVETAVGWAGVDLEVRLTEPNGFLQEVKADGDITNGVQVVGVVRTKVNGKDVKPRGVALYKYWNNVAREFDHPGEYDVWGGSFVGLDRFLADDFAADLESVESVTYEIVNLAAEDVTDLDAAVSSISVSNLNAYASADAEGEGTLRNREITYAYSLRRDIPNVYVSPSGMVDDPMVVFEYDNTSVYTSTRYWVEVSNATTGVVYPTTLGDGGILLERPIDGVVKVDLLSVPGLTLASNTVYSVRVALGNDKFGKPEADEDWSLPASFKVGAEPAFGGSITVTVNHPTVAAPSGSLKIAVYDKADLATPVKVVDGTVGTPQAVSGLRVGGDYYVAAWLVKDANDGRADPNGRQPYDTWGYATELGVDATCFDAFAVRASATPGAATATVYLQDTDWNDNGIVDREEEFLAVDAIVTRTLTAGDLELEGLPEEGVPSDTEDVMAYAKVARTLVLVGMNAATAAWYTLPAGYDVSVGVAATNLPAGVARTTYVYAGKTHGPYGEGAAKTFAATDGNVLAVEDGEVVLVHSQVYEEFGFNWATANRTLDASERVNSKIFTPMDKAYVVAYLRAIGVTVAPADEAAWSLNRSKTDFDYDGMPDGWELYVMFGPSVAAKTPSISPLVYDDRANDPDNDGLENVGEYDDGFMPTDPWDKDTDDDGVEDKASRDYLFKYGGTGDGLTGYRGDYDNDQLSNLIEYMIQGLTNFPDVVASKMSTFKDTEDQLVPDYFLPHGLLYLGEMFTDHDMIEDWWEDAQPSETMVGAERAANYSRYSYDASSDSDGDGWSNWAEARLAIAGGKVTVTEIETNVVDGVTVVTSNDVEKAAYEVSGKPTPTVEAALRYNGDKTSLNSDDKLVVMAWGPSRPTVAECDAAWVMPVGDLANGLMQVNLAEPVFGALREGENTFVAYVVGTSDNGGSEDDSTSAIPVFAVGKPYGVATGVRVSYLRGTPFTLELTHVDPTMARVNLPEAIEIQKTLFADALAAKDEEWWAGFLVPDADEGTQWWEYYAMMDAAYEGIADACTDRGEGIWDWATLQRASHYAATNLVFSAPGTVRVWITQALINGKDNKDGLYYKELIDLGDVDLEKHPVLTEADILTALIAKGEYDLGWSTLVNSYTNTPGIGNKLSLTNALFEIVLERKPSATYPQYNNVLALAVKNHYDPGRYQPDVTNKTVVTAGSQPTFSWQHVSMIGKPYPAFQLRVWKKSDSTLVYDSGAQRAPARDANGVYRWTAPLWAGSITPQGVVFEADEDYVWDVSMLDAKFPTFHGSAASGAALRVSDTSGDSLISDYGSIAVAVKYMGPGAVSTNGIHGVVRVEAYGSPDFSGLPLAAGYVMNTNTMAATDTIALNAIVKGLPKGGEYYVLAYLDSNGDGVRQAWESWGYGCYVGDPDRRDVYTPRAYGVATDAAGDLKTPTCVVYLEDADTNGNKLPDSLEVDLATGEFTGTNVTALSSPYIVTVETNGLIAATNIFAAIEKDIVALPYYSTLVEMKNGDSLASASLALAMSGVNLAALSVEPGVAITGFDPSVGISVEIDPGVTVDHDTLVASAVNLSIELEVEVEWTPNLATAWTLIVDPITGVPAKATLSIADVTTIDASDTTSTAGSELYNKINTHIVSIATTNPSAFFRIKSVKAVYK